MISNFNIITYPDLPLNTYTNTNLKNLTLAAQPAQPAQSVKGLSNINTNTKAKLCAYSVSKIKSTSPLTPETLSLVKSKLHLHRMTLVSNRESDLRQSKSNRYTIEDLSRRLGIDIENDAETVYLADNSELKGYQVKKRVMFNGLEILIGLKPNIKNRVGHKSYYKMFRCKLIFNYEPEHDAAIKKLLKACPDLILYKTEYALDLDCADPEILDSIEQTLLPSVHIPYQRRTLRETENGTEYKALGGKRKIITPDGEEKNGFRLRIRIYRKTANRLRIEFNLDEIETKEIFGESYSYNNSDCKKVNINLLTNIKDLTSNSLLKGLHLFKKINCYSERVVKKKRVNYSKKEKKLTLKERAKIKNKRKFKVIREQSDEQKLLEDYIHNIGPQIVHWDVEEKGDVKMESSSSIPVFSYRTAVKHLGIINKEIAEVWNVEENKETVEKLVENNDFETMYEFLFKGTRVESAATCLLFYLKECCSPLKFFLMDMRDVPDELMSENQKNVLEMVLVLTQRELQKHSKVLRY